MTKKLYEERKIEAIADKIRYLVPNLYKAQFDTAEMPDGIERVYEEGKSKGRTEGYNSGYGTGYSEGYTRGNKTGYDKGYQEGYSEANLNNTGGYDDGYHEGYKKGLTQGAEKVKTEEARTADDLEFERLGTYDLGLTVPSGYYGDGVTKIIDVEPYYDEGYDKGLAEGIEKVKTEEARTANDITQQDNIVFVPSGYYAEDTDMEINTDQYYDQGYEAGFTAGAESVGSYEDGNGVKY